MTSINYSVKGFSTAFKQNFKRQSVGTAVTIIIAGFGALAGFAYITSYMAGNIPSGSTYDGTGEMIAIMSFSMVICAFYSLFLAPRLFNQIYSKRACDFYFSAPIKRSAYFNANMLYGAMANVIIVVAPSLVFFLLCKIQPSYIVKFNYIYVFNAMGGFLTAALASFSILIMCAVCAGRKIHYIINVYICIISTMYVVSGFLSSINSIWGMKAKSILFPALNPLINVISVFFNSDDRKAILVLSAVSAAELIITYAVGFMLFKNRKAEVAELSVSGKIVPYVFLSVVLASAFLYFSTISEFLPIVISGVFFAVVLSIVFSLVFYKKVFTKQTGITCAAVCAVCICFLCIIYFPKYSNYVEYIPEQSEIEDVRVSNPLISSYSEPPIGNLIANATDYYNDDEWQDSNVIVFKSENGISGIRELHKKIISEETIKASQVKPTDLYSYIASGFGYIDEAFDQYNVMFEYNLKNGKTVTRTYSVNAHYVYDEFVKAFKNEETLSQIEPFKLESDNILFITVDYYDENDMIQTKKIRLDSYDELLSLMLKDRMGESDRLFVMDSYELGMDYVPDGESEYEDDSVYLETESNQYYDVGFYHLNPDLTDEERKRIENMTENQIINNIWDIDGVDVDHFTAESRHENTIKYIEHLING